MMEFVQSQLGFVTPGTTYNISISPLAGNLLVVTHTQTTAGTRTVVLSDNIGGTAGWVEASWYNPGAGMGAGVWVKANVPAGITTVTVSFAGPTVNGQGSAAEFGSVGAAVAIEALDTFLDGGSSNNHQSSSLGVSATPEVLAVCAGALSAAGTISVIGAGYTALRTSSVCHHQYRQFLTGCTSELGLWSNTGTARIGTCTIVLISGNSSSVGTIPSTSTAPAFSNSIFQAVGSAVGTSTGAWFAELSAQWAVPDGDTNPAGWTPSTGSDLFAMIDERPAVDSDYIQSVAFVQGDYCQVALAPLTTPGAGDVIISVRHGLEP